MLLRRLLPSRNKEDEQVTRLRETYTQALADWQCKLQLVEVVDSKYSEPAILELAAARQRLEMAIRDLKSPINV